MTYKAAVDGFCIVCSLGVFCYFRGTNLPKGVTLHTLKPMRPCKYCCFVRGGEGDMPTSRETLSDNSGRYNIVIARFKMQTD